MRRAKDLAKAAVAKQQHRECFKFSFELTVHGLIGLESAQAAD